jgi:putative redox protein
VAVVRYFKDVTAVWRDDLEFDATAGSGFSVKVDGHTQTGFSPMELVLVGLAGCTGNDVIEILRKMRQDVTGLEVRVHGDRAEECPRKFTHIQVTYALAGRGLDLEAVRRAIELSETKYCSVSATLRGVAEIVHRVEIREAAPLPAASRANADGPGGSETS